MWIYAMCDLSASGLGESSNQILWVSLSLSLILILKPQQPDVFTADSDSKC